jgi:Putative zinc-finger
MRISYSCKQISKLISQAQDEPLGAVDQLKLKFHLAICGDCQNVEQQMTQMNDLMRNSFLFDDSLVDNSNTHQNAKKVISDS